MPARTGNEFIQGLKDHPPEIWIGGERVGDVAAHPAFRNVVRSVAALYDLQHDAALRDQMTFVSPSSGERVGMSFLVPRTHDDLAHVRRMMKVWADYSGGMMGRAPDYLNRAITAFAAAAPYCGENDPRFADNVRRYYEHCRDRDLCLTHTLINPQANRSAGPSGQADPYLAAAIVRETDAGVIIRGARMLATLPLADEILVFPSTLLRGKDEDRPYAFAFAIPCSASGLKFICRETFDPGGSTFDHPLASRFEEMDAVVIFEDVIVPWERVFLLRDVERCNKAFSATGAVAHQADMESPLRPLIEKYFQAAQADAVDRIKLFRLAWDATLSSFGSRQVIYERFFFGDPVRMQMATFASYDRLPYVERVRQFLAREHALASRS